MTRTLSGTRLPEASTVGVATSASTGPPRSTVTAFPLASVTRPGSCITGSCQVRTSASWVEPADTTTKRSGRSETGVAASVWGGVVKGAEATRAGRGFGTGIDSGRMRIGAGTLWSSTGSKRTTSSKAVFATAAYGMSMPGRLCE